MKNNLFNRIYPWLLGLLITSVVIYPIFQGRLFRAHDFTHVARLAELDRTISDGFFPPRWSKNLGFGYGMPIFSFYAPLPYYLGEIFHVLGFSYEMSIQLIFSLVFYFSYMVAFVFSRQFWNRGGAVLAATLFIYAPYRAVDTYARGSLGELFGIMFIMICLLTVTKIIYSNNKKWFIYLSISIAGLMLSHNLMALIGLPVITAYGLTLIYFLNKHKVNKVVSIALSILLGFCLSSFFIIPAFLEKSATSVDELTKGGGSYLQHFVYLRQLLVSPFGYGGSIEGIFDGISFELGKIHIGLFIFSWLIMFLAWKKYSQKQKSLVIFSSVVIGLSIFLMSFYSRIIWDNLPLIKYLQFPWRLLSLTLIFLSIVGGLIGDWLINKWEKLGKFILVGILLLVVAYYANLFKPEYYPDNNDPIYSTDELYIKERMSQVIPDYINPQMSELVLSTEKNITIPKERFRLQSNDDISMKIVEDKSQSFSLDLTGTGLATVSANIFDFPGWKWYVNKQPVNHQVETDLPTMSIQVELTDNESINILGELEDTSVRLISNWISIVSLGLIGLLGLTKDKKTK